MTDLLNDVFTSEEKNQMAKESFKVEFTADDFNQPAILEFEPNVEVEMTIVDFTEKDDWKRYTCMVETGTLKGNKHQIYVRQYNIFILKDLLKAFFTTPDLIANKWKYSDLIGKKFVCTPTNRTSTNGKAYQSLGKPKAK